MSEIRGRRSLRKEQSNPDQSEQYGEASTDDEISENEQDKSSENNASKGIRFTTISPREAANASRNLSYNPESIGFGREPESPSYSSKCKDFRSPSKSPLMKEHSLQGQEHNKLQESSPFQNWRFGTCAKCLCLFVSILGYIIYVYSHTTDYQTDNQTDREKKSCSYQDLKEKYPQQDAIIWHGLQVGIERILNAYDKKSGVYLFIHYENSNVDGIVEDIVKHASKCYNEKMKPIHMNISNFNSPKAIKDYGHIIEDFKKHIRKSKVIVVVNVNAIPPETARALHTLCDTENPIDKDVVVFLTLQIPTVPIDNDNDLERNVEKILNNLWSNGMKSYELDPLITRVTNNLVLLKGNTSIETF